MPLTFRQAEFALAFMNDIDPARRGAFEARLKQWQKMGFPAGVNVGRGTKATYGATQIHQLMIMLKLLSVGLTPERAIKVVIAGWETFKESIVETTICLANGENHLHYCQIKLDALSELKAGRADHMHIFVDLLTGEQIADAFVEPEPDANDTDKLTHRYAETQVKNRLALSISLEMDSMLILLWTALAPLELTPEIFADEIREWEKRRRAERRLHQNDERHFDRQLATRSIADHVIEFDVVAAARQSLAKVAG